jgi:hypothetical protein
LLPRQTCSACAEDVQRFFQGYDLHVKGVTFLKHDSAEVRLSWSSDDWLRCCSRESF